VLQAVAARVGPVPVPAAVPAGAEPAAGPDGAEPPTPLPGYQVVEVTLGPESAAVGKPLGAIRWPAHAIPVSLQRSRRLTAPDPAITLVSGDRVSVLTPEVPAEA
jgi:CIC family chloride channel protein